MALVFNPFTGNFDNVMASSSDMSFSGGSLNVNGDITLDSGGAFTTTVQAVTPTANRTISFPDQTGTVGLVSGATGNIQYNNAGQLAGTGDLNTELDWVSPTGTYTALKVNADSNSGNTGTLLDLQVDGTSKITFRENELAFDTGTTTIYAGTGAGSNIRIGGIGTIATSPLDVAYSNITIANRATLGFTTGTNINSGIDIGLKRDSAGVIAVTDGSTGLGTLQGQLRAQGTAPASSTDPGTIGDIRVAGSTLYVHNGSQWTRVTLDTTAF